MTIEQLQRENICLQKVLLKYCLSATAWSPNHTTAQNNKYTKGTLVWFEDYIYKSLLPNNSAPVTDTYFWEKVGRGFLLAQEPSTGGSINYIRNHDFVIGTDYNGYAPEGSLISDAVWTITKLTINPNGSVVRQVATNVKWIDRYTTTYV